MKERLATFSSVLLPLSASIVPHLHSMHPSSFPITSLCSLQQNNHAIRYTSTGFFPLHFTRNGLRGKISQFFKLATPLSRKKHHLSFNIKEKTPYGKKSGAAAHDG
jgi:hypothetical protein